MLCQERVPLLDMGPLSLKQALKTIISLQAAKHHVCTEFFTLSSAAGTPFSFSLPTRGCEQKCQDFGSWSLWEAYDRIATTSFPSDLSLQLRSYSTFSETVPPKSIFGIFCMIWRKRKLGTFLLFPWQLFRNVFFSPNEQKENTIRFLY